MEDKKEEKNSSILHGFQESNADSVISSGLIIALIVVAVLGVGTGFLLAQGKGAALNIGKGNSSSVPKGAVVGSNDTKTFKDTTEGLLKQGGINGEGQYHLVRPGGESQNVYLTSSIVDLSAFLGRKIKVWGETQKAQHAGWLMDVGRIQVLE